MQQLLLANRKLYQDWMMIAFEQNVQNVATDISRLAVGMQGTIPREQDPIDATQFFNGIAEKLRGEFSTAKKIHLESVVGKAISDESLLIGETAGSATRLMHYGLILLALCAIFLVVSF